MKYKGILFLGNLALGALVFWAAASVVLTWVSQRQSAGFLDADSSGPASAREKVSRQIRSLADYGVISEKDVFRSAKNAAESAVVRETEIKMTELNLELKGTVVGEGRSSYAVIMDHESGKEDVYFLDDFVMGARIARIGRSRVILDLSGNEEALLMGDESRALPEIGSSTQVRSTRKEVPPFRPAIGPGRGAGTPGR